MPCLYPQIYTRGGAGFQRSRANAAMFSPNMFVGRSYSGALEISGWAGGNGGKAAAENYF